MISRILWIILVLVILGIDLAFMLLFKPGCNTIKSSNLVCQDNVCITQQTSRISCGTKLDSVDGEVSKYMLNMFGATLGMLLINGVIIAIILEMNRNPTLPNIPRSTVIICCLSYIVGLLTINLYVSASWSPYSETSKHVCFAIAIILTFLSVVVIMIHLTDIIMSWYKEKVEEENTEDTSEEEEEKQSDVPSQQSADIVVELETQSVA